MSESQAIAMEGHDTNQSSKLPNIYVRAKSLSHAAAEQAKSLSHAAAVQAISLRDAAAAGVKAVPRKLGEAAETVALAPFSTKHQNYYEVIQKFLALRDRKHGSVDNMTIGDFKDIFKEVTSSKDVLKEFVDTILKEIENPDEIKEQSINNAISEMSSGDLAFGLKLRNSDKFTTSIKDDKLATVEKVLTELLELIRRATLDDVEESKKGDAGGSGVKRKKSKARTFKKKYLRRKTSKKRRQKKTAKKSDKKRRQKKATKKRA